MPSFDDDDKNVKWCSRVELTTLTTLSFVALPEVTNARGPLPQ